MPRPTPRLLALTAAAVGLAFAPGCREELGPARFPKASVAGVVLQAGSPVTGGWVELQPIDGAVGDIRSAKIQPDGSFRREGVAIGPNRIRLVDVPGLSMNVAAILYNRVQIIRTIPPDPGEPIRVDLAEELKRLQDAENARSRPASY